jgi:serine/threonine protein kinase
MSQQHCSTCSKLANDSVRQLCGNATGGRVWLGHCFLRYDNSTFFSKLDTDGTYLQKRLNDVGTYNLNNLRTTTSKLLSNLSEKAYAPANKGFAEGFAAYSSIYTVYGLVQCWRDISIKDCRSCLQLARDNLYNCCSLKQGAQALLGSCRVRYAEYNFLTTSGGSSNASPPASSGSSNPPKGAVQTTPANGTSLTPSKDSSKTIPTILGILGGVLLGLAICLFAMRRKLKSAISGRPVPLAQNEGAGRPVPPAQNEETHKYGSESTLNQKQILFALEALIESTDNFDESNKLGEGGFGAVYQGNTKDGEKIAVKKLSVRSSQGNAEFMNEVKVLANVRHRNLVKLLGCCAEGPERLIVYEYLPNKSLHTLLFDPDHKPKLLDWQMRYKIIMGIARGLLYLHEESEPPVIHRDIKANNILLDKALNPKISDFGLARLFPEQESHIQTRVAGTYGYMAPEYAMRGQLSMKADVYSFGVLVLEIVSGRKVSDIDLPQETQSLSEWAWRSYKEGCLLNMIDSTVTKTLREEQAVRCIHVALLCTQADAGIRPTISNVILMISSSSGILPNPQKPAFVKTSESNLGGSTSRRIDESGTGTSLVSPALTQSPFVPSRNNVTITELEGR